MGCLGLSCLVWSFCFLLVMRKPSFPPCSCFGAPEQYYCSSRAVLAPCRHGTTMERYSWARCASDLHQSGTTAPCAVLPLRAGRVGYVSGRGSFHSPIPVQFAHLLVLSSLRRLPKHRRSAAGPPDPGRLPRFQPVGSFPTLSSCHGCGYCPRSSLPWFSFLNLGFGAILVASLDLVVESRLRKDLGDC